MRTNDANDEDFSDLEPIAKWIGDAQIVQLGEQSHGDGSCFECKIRLVKFLHQRMGFDVLAFESGIYDCHRAWQAFRDGEPPIHSAELGVFSIWTGSQQTTPLWTYLGSQAHSERPLELAGFDCQLTGAASRLYFLKDLKSLSTRVDANLDDGQWSEFETSWDALIQSRHVDCNWERLTFVLNAVQTKLRAQSDSVVPDLMQWNQQLSSLNAHVAFLSQARVEGTDAGSKSINHRDELMANNLLWLTRDRYPNRKIIVWAASFHIARHLKEIRQLSKNVDYQSTIPMGQHVEDNLGNKVYSIAFTAYDGKAGPWFRKPFSISPAPEGTLEKLCMEAEMQTAMIPLRGIEDQAFLHSKQWARPLGYAWMEASWPKHFDAIIFQRTMSPSASR